MAGEAAASASTRFQTKAAAQWFWKFRLLRAEALLAQARIEEALALTAEPIHISGDSSQLELRRLMDRADAASKSGRLEEAAAALERVRGQARDPGLQVRVDVLRGAVLARLGQLPGAEQVLHTAEQEAIKRGDAYEQAASLINLSSCKKWSSHYSEAVEYGQQALKISEQNGFGRLAAVESGNLGSFYRILGDFDGALDYGRKAVTALTAIGDNGNLLIALGELGLLYDAQQQYDDAIKGYERAYELARRMGRNGDAARNADNLASVLIKLRQWDKAEHWNEESRRLTAPDSASGPYQTFNAAGIAWGRGQPAAALRLYREVVARSGVPASLLWECHYYLGLAYREGRNYSLAEREYRAAVDLIDKTRSDLLAAAQQITFLSRLIAIHQSYVDFLIEMHDDAGALRAAEASRARVLAARLGRDVLSGGVDTPSLTQLARETSTTMISFWLAPRRSFAWLIDKSGVRRFELPGSETIEPLVTAYRNVVEHALRDPIASGDPNGPKLWDALLGQIAPRVAIGSRVVVIPDGPLHRLNLETLPVPGARPHYWAEDVQLAIAPSLAIAASKPRDHAARPAALLLIGAADYSGTGYRPLEHAGLEIRDVQDRFPGAVQAVYTGRQASPAAYRNSQPDRFSLIHFAAHAEASNENPLESAVVLSRRGDDYKLYARDVIDVPISADLVTISGCRSAGVRAYAGEGLIGFAWAFLDAGARAVIAGLWDVSDSSTEPLMNRFYGGLAAGKDPVAAMHDAKLTLLHTQPQYAKPFYWAPFQVYLRTVRK